MVNDLFGKVYSSSQVLLSMLNSHPPFPVPASGFSRHPEGISLPLHDFQGAVFIFPFHLPSHWRIITVPLNLLAMGDLFNVNFKN